MAIDVCLIFNVGRRLFFNVFPFPVCKAELIGYWLENRRGAPNCLVRLFLKPQSTYIYRVPQFMSPRQNWDSPIPSLATECATYPGTKGRAFSPASEGLGKSQFRRLEKSPALCLLCVWNHRSANILAHRWPPPPIGIADQTLCANNSFFLFGPPFLLAQGASVRQ